MILFDKHRTKSTTARAQLRKGGRWYDVAKAVRLDDTLHILLTDKTSTRAKKPQQVTLEITRPKDVRAWVADQANVHTHAVAGGPSKDNPGATAVVAQAKSIMYIPKQTKVAR